MNNEIKEYVVERYITQGFENWDEDLNNYNKLKSFAPEGNIFESGQTINDGTHFIMRTTVQYYLSKAFESMKVDLTNPNVSEDLSVGNIGTAGRISKVWCGFDTEDDTELGAGRWRKKPRLATFPNTHKESFPITKRVSLTSNCSHHFLPFSTIFREDSYAIISYIPGDKVLGISKLQRVVDWVSQRFFLQEDLTRMIYEEVSKSAETEDVFVKLFNLQHTCESTRGSKSPDGSFTSEYFGGKYKKTKLRNAVIEGN